MFYICSEKTKYVNYAEVSETTLLLDNDFFKLKILACSSYTAKKNYNVNVFGGKERVNIEYYKNGLFGWHRIKDNFHLGTKKDEMDNIFDLLTKYGFKINDRITTNEKIHEEDKSIKSIETYRSLSGDIEVTPLYIKDYFPDLVPTVERIINNPNLSKIANDIVVLMNTHSPIRKSYRLDISEEDISIFHYEEFHSKMYHATDGSLKFKDYGMNAPTSGLRDSFLGVLIGVIVNTSEWKYDDWCLYNSNVKETTLQDW